MTMKGLISDLGVILRNNWDIYSRLPFNTSFNAGYVIKSSNDSRVQLHSEYPVYHIEEKCHLIKAERPINMYTCLDDIFFEFFVI
jgi:hypothetical protein